ncbi:hypothetical protein H0R94_11710 [Treponema socranskii]|uniref:hypothetical protein n=1 Tax=Treponema socranskii TaxID=53419 RepID=UPI003D8F1459
MGKDYEKFFVDYYVAYDDRNFEAVKEWNKQHKADEKLLCPQFLSPLLEYEHADLKVMIFGQEALRWHNPDDSMNFYEDGHEPKDYSDLYSDYMQLLNGDDVEFKKGGIRKAPFNKEYRRLRNLIQETAKKYGKSAGFMWNNLIKLTALKGGSGKRYFNKVSAIQESSLLIKEELNFFKPNILIFLTGPDYDFVIQNEIKGTHIFDVVSKDKVEPFNDRMLSVFNIKNIDLALRTYHPGAHRTAEEWSRLHGKTDQLIADEIDRLYSK